MPDLIIDKPGLYEIPEDQYHADPVPAELGGSLSVTSAKKLLRPGGPAIFRWEREHPKPSTTEMELGTAAHKLVLGVGQELREVKAGSWRTNKAKDEAKEAREAGAIPLLTADMETVHAMAAMLREHPTASRLLEPGRGEHEVSGFWEDSTFGIWRRCRFDVLGNWRPLVVDYKTAADASPDGFAKAVDRFRYDMQADWYSEAHHALCGDWPAFLFITQEKAPPYLVGVYQLDSEAMEAGHGGCERAIRAYLECTETGHWPGYSADIETLSLPRWAAAREDLI